MNARIFVRLFVVPVLCLWTIFAVTVRADERDRHDQRRHQAIEEALQRVANQPDASADALVRLGDALLRGGRCEEAVDHFEKAIKLDPQLRPYLWQHGIALFFVGRFDAAAALFEKHRLVNPHDVENAAWHFLCVAKSKGLEKAREIILPAPGDSRVPMNEVLQRLHGGDSSAIVAAITQTDGTPDSVSARFYGNLYMGIIADAEGDAEAMKKYLAKAAGTPLTHYMADVARVYSQKKN